MAVRIRLRRMGAKKQPFYRVVVADSRSPRDGRFLDTIGTYNPRSEPARIHIDREKALRWLEDGAQPTDSARSLLSKAGVWQRFKTGAWPADLEPAVAGPEASEEPSGETDSGVGEEPSGEADSPEEEAPGEKA